MKRKVIKQGHNTMTLTLPSKWVKEFNLKPGDEIDIAERDNGIFVSAQNLEDKRKVEICIDELDNPTIWKYFMAVYREGYDEVLVKFKPDLKLDNPYKFFTRYILDDSVPSNKKKTPNEFLQSLVNRFIGYEVLDCGNDFALVSDMSEPSSKEFDNSLRRVFLLIQQMSNETFEAISSRNFKTLKHIHDVDVNVDKFHDYCIRILNKLKSKDSRESSLLFSTLYLLELVGDEFKNISHHFLKDISSKCNFSNLLEMAKLKKEQIDLFYESFYVFDLQKIMRISKIDEEEYNVIKEVYAKTNSEEEKEVLHHYRIISRYINALIELRIEMDLS